MMEAAFTTMIKHMTNVPKICSETVPEISAADYLEWKQGFLFDALQGLRYGQSFCNCFDITDNILFYERDLEWADAYIRSYYVP